MDEMFRLDDWTYVVGSVWITLDTNRASEPTVPGDWHAITMKGGHVLFTQPTLEAALNMAFAARVLFEPAS